MPIILLLDILICCFLGIVGGIFTGLLPAVHINLVAIIILSAFSASNFNPVLLAVFICSMAIAHSFLDFIPSLVFGMPSGDTALAMLPGHRLLKKGRGKEAIFLSACGGLIAYIMFVLFFVFSLYKLIPLVYSVIAEHIAWILILCVGAIIFLSKNRVASSFCFILAGIYGIACFDSPVSSSHIMLPMLSGLFGFSNLILSISQKAKIPKQKTTIPLLDKMKLIKSSFTGLVAGIVAGFLPGFGSSQSGFLVEKFASKNNSKYFIATLGAINTIDLIMSIMCIYLISRARSGSGIAIEKLVGMIEYSHVVLFIGVGAISATVSFFLVMKAGDLALKYVSRINYTLFNVSMLVFAGSVVLYFTGGYGLFICFTGTALGIYTRISNVRLSILMGCLIIPVILAGL
ncbi:MAG: tripartite tricarboxylate transporter permease [Candidatus Aenigmarchaeota archaeon]|nr:tripartite tricarboxylate transporter permease [Candidatus Aenigmarchaeota archaeon]